MKAELEAIKIDFSRCKCRKDVLELLGDNSKALPIFAAAVAWEDFAKALESLGSPDRPRGPRYNDLVTAFYGAYLKGMTEWIKQGMPAVTIELEKSSASAIEADSCQAQRQSTQMETTRQS